MTQPNTEAAMAARLRDGDYAGATELFASAGAGAVNVRMVNMAFSAAIGSGRNIEGAAVEMLRACESHTLQPTAALYNNVLAALAKRGPPEAVLSWLAKMRSCAVALDVQACNVNLKAHAALGDISSAGMLLTQMMRQSDGLPMPDAVSYNTVIGAYQAEPAKGAALLTTMIDTGLAADERSFTTVIGAYASAGNPTEACKWLQRMTEAGLMPDTFACNAVLAAFASVGDAEGAKQLLAHFERRAADECPRARPDLCSHNTLIAACARAGQPAAAEEAFATLVARGHAPDQRSYASVIAAHAKAGDAHSGTARVAVLAAPHLATTGSSDCV